MRSRRWSCAAPWPASPPEDWQISAKLPPIGRRSNITEASICAYRRRIGDPAAEIFAPDPHRLAPAWASPPSSRRCNRRSRSHRARRRTKRARSLEIRHVIIADAVVEEETIGLDRRSASVCSCRPLRTCRREPEIGHRWVAELRPSVLWPEPGASRVSAISVISRVATSCALCGGPLRPHQLPEQFGMRCVIFASASTLSVPGGVRARAAPRRPPWKRVRSVWVTMPRACRARSRENARSGAPACGAGYGAKLGWA